MTVLLVAAGGRAPDAAVIRDDRAAAGHATGARRVADAIVAANVSGKEAEGHGVREIGCQRDRAELWGFQGSPNRPSHGPHDRVRTKNLAGLRKWKESRAKKRKSRSTISLPSRQNVD